MQIRKKIAKNEIRISYMPALAIMKGHAWQGDNYLKWNASRTTSGLFLSIFLFALPFSFQRIEDLPGFIGALKFGIDLQRLIQFLFCQVAVAVLVVCHAQVVSDQRMSRNLFRCLFQ